MHSTRVCTKRAVQDLQYHNLKIMSALGAVLPLSSSAQGLAAGVLLVAAHCSMHERIVVLVVGLNFTGGILLPRVVQVTGLTHKFALGGFVQNLLPRLVQVIA